VREIETFEDLDVWQVCREIRKKVYIVANDLPSMEQTGLARQLRRAAISLTANIAERFGRFHYRENIQFCRQARGSLYEILDHLTTCLDQGYIEPDRFQAMRSELLRAARLLNGYIRMLQKTPLPDD
jgi:four helix bundle protein